MAEDPKNFSGVRSEGNKIFVTGNPARETKQAFYQVMSERVRVVDEQDYRRMFPESNMAHFNQVVYKTSEGKMIEDGEVYVCRGDFIVNGQDFTDMIPIAVRHELAEAWTYAKTGYSLSPARRAIGNEERVQIGHGLALRAEWEYAFELGKAERYLEYIKLFAEARLSPQAANSIIAENEGTYQLIKSRAGKRKV